MERSRDGGDGGSPMVMAMFPKPNDSRSVNLTLFSPATGNDSSTSSEEEEGLNLEDYLGPRHRSVAVAVIFTAVYTLIFLTGIVGNAFTCLVIVRNKRMHTATNYYLFSLAISDVLTLLLGLPPELYTILEAYPWRFGEPYCLFKTFLTEMTSSASILTIVSFTVERYLAICHSLRAQTMSGLSRALRTIGVIWIVACVTSVPYPVHTRTYYHVDDPRTNQPVADSLICNIPRKWTDSMSFAFQMSTFLLFVLPMALISALYVQIGLALRRSEATRRCSCRPSGAPSRAHSKKSVFKMLVAVVVAFFICFAPFHAQRLMTIYVREDQWTDTWLDVQSNFFYVTGILYFVSCTVNPILYNLMSRNYRQAFKMTLCCFCANEAVDKLKLRYTGTVLYSERTAVADGTQQHHCGGRPARRASAWVDPSIRNRRTRPATHCGPTAAVPVTTTAAAAAAAAEAEVEPPPPREEGTMEDAINDAINEVLRITRN